FRHAMEADHLAAVSTLVSQHRSLTRACLLGACWGAGHTAALLAAGLGVIAFKLTITPAVEQGLETLVGFMLVLLGAHVLLRSVGAWSLHHHPHAHSGQVHSHVHAHIGGGEPGHVHLLRMGGRPFLIGVVHGLAGSAALVLLVLAAIPSLSGGLVYILVFGAGSTAGMLALSGLMGIPFRVAAERGPRWQAAIQALAGAVSLAVGVAVIWKSGA